jgi:hypothetical protein
MNDQLTPPGERDLPARHASEMRAELMTAVRGPRPRPTRRWLVAAVSATAVVTAVAAVTLTHQVRDDDTQILALGPGELSSGLKRGAERCLKWNAEHATPRDDLPSDARPGPEDIVPVSMGDIAVASRQGGKVSILFLNDIGYVSCDVSYEDGQEVSGGMGVERWPHREWLPGPFQRLSLMSTEQEGGDVAALGRVSARVHRLVLERGNGKSTTARLANGAFGILTTTGDVRPGAEVVAYDAGRSTGSAGVTPTAPAR